MCFDAAPTELRILNGPSTNMTHLRCWLPLPATGDCSLHFLFTLALSRPVFPCHNQDKQKTNNVDCICWSGLTLWRLTKESRTIMRSTLINKRRVVLAHAELEKKTDQKTVPKKLTGADLYAINCARCHPERYATEFTSAQWKTIMLHMRVRANLPAAQAKVILKYLQEDSGN